MDRKVRFLTSLAYWGALGALTVFFALFLFPKILPFLLGFSVAALFEPLVRRCAKGKSRWFASSVVILPFWGIVLFLLWKLGSLIYAEAGQLLQWLRTADIGGWIAALPIMPGDEQTREKILSWIGEQLPAVLNLSQDLLVRLIGLLMKLPDAFLFSFAMVVSSLLISASYPAWEPFLLRQMPARLQSEYFDVKLFLTKTVLRVLRAYGILFCLNYAQIALGLVVLHVSYPLILAALIAVLDLLPFIGTATVLVPWGLAELFFFSNPFTGAGLLVLALVVSVVREILQTKIVGKHMGLSPLATLISIYLGLKIFGFFGVFVFPLLFLFLKEWNGSGRISLWKNSPE